MTRTAMTAMAMTMEPYSTGVMVFSYAFDVSLLLPERGISMTIRNTVTATATAMKKYSAAFMIYPLEAMERNSVERLGECCWCWLASDSSSLKPC